MAADVRISGEMVEVGAVRAVFTRVLPTGGYVYDVSADGQRLPGGDAARNSRSADHTG